MDESAPKGPSEERRRRRWLAFLTPLITLGSIVISVAMLMALIKSCSDRNPQNPGGPRLPIQRMPTEPPPSNKFFLA